MDPREAFFSSGAYLNGGTPIHSTYMAQQDHAASNPFLINSVPQQDQQTTLPYQQNQYQQSSSQQQNLSYYPSTSQSSDSMQYNVNQANTYVTGGQVYAYGVQNKAYQYNGYGASHQNFKSERSNFNNAHSSGSSRSSSNRNDNGSNYYQPKSARSAHNSNQRGGSMGKPVNRHGGHQAKNSAPASTSEPNIHSNTAKRSGHNPYTGAPPSQHAESGRKRKSTQGEIQYDTDDIVDMSTFIEPPHKHGLQIQALNQQKANISMIWRDFSNNKVHFKSSDSDGKDIFTTDYVGIISSAIKIMQADIVAGGGTAEKCPEKNFIRGQSQLYKTGFSAKTGAVITELFVPYFERGGGETVKKKTKTKKKTSHYTSQFACDASDARSNEQRIERHFDNDQSSPVVDEQHEGGEKVKDDEGGEVEWAEDRVGDREEGKRERGREEEEEKEGEKDTAEEQGKTSPLTESTMHGNESEPI